MEDILLSVPEEERSRLRAFFQEKNRKNKPIANPSIWMRDCIKHGWHKIPKKPKKLDEVSIIMRNAELAKENKAWAMELLKKVEFKPGESLRLTENSAKIQSGHGVQYLGFAENGFRDKFSRVLKAAQKR